MKLTILTTGGTIEKTYNEHKGLLKNFDSVLDQIMQRLRLPDIEMKHVPVMNKDSLDMTLEDRICIKEELQKQFADADAILILHGTDTLEDTGNYLYDSIQTFPIPVVMTGAMRPYEFRDSDAIQNVTESLLAMRLVNPGLFVVMHNRVLEFPNIFKNRDTLHFDKK